MTALFADIASALPPEGSWPWGVVAAVVGVVGGRLLTRLIGARLDAGVFGEPGTRVEHRRWMEASAAVVAVALWWWEACCLGLSPPASTGAVAVSEGAEALVRWAAHAVLFWLLAAAAWIDIRHRVIPDCVTVPGVIVGLVAVALFPDILLPITHEEPRSFAVPLATSDVLAWWGALRRQSPPVWLSGRPHAGGLALSAGIFAAWWLFFTSPASWHVADSEGPGGRRGIDLRTVLLPAGLAVIAAAWARGGDNFAGLQSGLVGIAISAGIVWAVREGASRALGREAMGLGDVTLMAMVGAWTGWQAGVLAFFVAAFIGLAHGLTQVVRHRENELPYGPSLCLASATVIVGWRQAWEWSEPAFSQPLELAIVLVVVVLLTALTLFGWRCVRR